MIVRDKPNAFMLFFVVQGSVVPVIAPQILISAFVAIIVHLGYLYLPSFIPDFTVTPFVLLGVTLSIFLGFRNRASYERWWEARKQWGQLIIDTRSIARQAQTYIVDAPTGTTSQLSSGKANKYHRRIALLAVAFSHALRHHLRDTDSTDDIAPFLTELDKITIKTVQHIPNFILNLLGAEIRTALQNNLIGEISARNLEERITAMASVLAACERIHNTPLPFAYSLLLHRTAYIYCFTLPFGLVASLGVLTPFVTAVIAYTFFGLDALGEELEGPFGTSPHDLALSSMSKTIEINLLETLSEPHLPAPLLPKKYNLS
ncbi:bestrophin family protein [Kiloniella antarctica]|uniref:Bestrophin family protein n=1 Tax=Kiloniella antarctica TaxID=1550907 RepID=A0ABW5BJW0_9PROT